MEKNNKGKTIFIIILILIILGLGGYIVYDKFIAEDKTESYKAEIEDLKKQVEELKSQEQQTKDEITLEDLYGTYTWEKNYVSNVSGSTLNLTYKIKLVLNEDGSATYDASNGIEAEQTKGKFTYEDGKIIYTREYFNYDTSTDADVYTDENNKTETFTVIDKDTLQNTYYDQITSIKRSE